MTYSSLVGTLNTSTDIKNLNYYEDTGKKTVRLDSIIYTFKSRKNYCFIEQQYYVVQVFHGTIENIKIFLLVISI